MVGGGNGGGAVRCGAGGGAVRCVSMRMRTRMCDVAGGKESSKESQNSHKTATRASSHLSSRSPEISPRFSRRSKTVGVCVYTGYFSMKFTTDLPIRCVAADLSRRLVVRYVCVCCAPEAPNLI